MDEQTLQVLKSIERLLKSSMSATEGHLPGAAKKGVARSLYDAATGANKDKRADNRMTAMSSSMSKTTSVVLGLNTSFKSLNTEVTQTSGGFSALRSQLSGLNKQLSGGVDTAPIAKFTEMLSKAASGNGPAGIGGGSPPSAQAASVLGDAAKQFSSGFLSRIRPDDIVVPLKVTATRMIENFSKVGTTTAALSGIFRNVSEVVKQLTTDYLALARVGLNANLADMSINALKAGMSLKEYTATLEQANNFATRVGSIDEYERVTSAANAQLATLGLFGAEAKAFQASLASSNTSIGVSQSNMTDVIASQVASFEQLRKTTNMTGDEFTKLMSSIAQNEQTQKELVGLDPQMRAARLSEISQIATTGQSLGLTAAASAKLTDALLAQRGDSVKGRYESAGRVRQAAAFAGLGADGERAAQITMKGRRATTDETEELRGILGKLDSAQQGIYETGSLGAQSVIDQQSEVFGNTGLGKLMQSNREANLSQQSGSAGSNKDFGNHVGTFGQSVGQFGALLKGFNESIGPKIAGAVGAGLLLAFRGPILKLLVGSLNGAAGGGIRGMMSGAAGQAGGMMGRMYSAAGNLGNLDLSMNRPFQNFGSRVGARATQAAGGISSGVRGTIGGVKSGFGSVMRGVQGAYGAVKGGTAGASLANIGTSVLETGGSLLKGAQGIIGGLKVAVRSFGPLAGLFDAGIELFTGEISNALNPNAGIMDRIGGAVSAFFSAIPNMIIDVIGFVFGEDLGKQLQNGFDTFVAAANGAIRFLFGKIFSGWGEILSYVLPDNSGLVKTLKTWGASADASATENFNTTAELYGDQSKTLSSISKTNTDAAKKNTDSANTATTSSVAAQSKFNNVALAGNVTASQMAIDAKSVLASATQAQTMMASPQVQVPATVGLAGVNTNTDTSSVTANEIAKVNKNAPDPNADVVTILSNILLVMKQNTDIGQAQVNNSAALLDLARPSAKFNSSEYYANLILRKNQA